MDNRCPKTEKCPLFNGLLTEKPETANIYRESYCTAGEKMYESCKRYIVSELIGSCPDFVMPNSSLTPEDIAEKAKYVK